jgi:hypothetical protein
MNDDRCCHANLLYTWPEVERRNVVITIVQGCSTDASCLLAAGCRATPAWPSRTALTVNLLQVQGRLVAGQPGAWHAAAQRKAGAGSFRVYLFQLE